MTPHTERIWADVVGLLAARVLDDPMQALQASRTGRFVIDGYQFAIELQPQSGQLVSRCLVPAQPATEAVLRAMLEYNLSAGMDGVVFSLSGDADTVQACVRHPAGLADGLEDEVGVMLMRQLSDAMRCVCATGPRLRLGAGGGSPDLAALLRLDGAGAAAAAASLRDLMAGVAAAMPGGEAAGEADGPPWYFDMDGTGVAVQCDAGEGVVGFYADMGLAPDPAAGAFSSLLRANAAQADAPVVFGLHPASGRMVACLRLPLALVTLAGDVRWAEDTLKELCGIARQARPGRSTA